jgi:hypothetical protein
MKQRVKGGELPLREADMLRKKPQDEAEEDEVQKFPHPGIFQWREHTAASKGEKRWREITAALIFCTITTRFSGA